MTTILETQVTDFLTTELGRAPTTTEVGSGMVSPWTLSQIQKTLNVPQSVLTISSGDDIQAAINNLSSNGGGVLKLSPGNYILSANIILPSAVSLEGAGPTNTLFVGLGLYGVVAHGTSGTHLTDIGISSMGFSGCTTALDFQYVDRFIFSDLLMVNCTKGMVIDNCQFVSAMTCNGVTSSSDTFTITNSSFFEWRSVNAITSGGVGFVMNTLSEATMFPCGSTGATSHGMTMTSCSDITLLGANSSNGGDGLQLTTTNTCKISLGGYNANSGHGITIASGTGNIILGNSFAGNSSGAASDSGTGTVIRSNYGLVDN